MFYQTTLEEQYTGEIFLSVGNFISDGIWLIWIFNGLTWYKGNSWWNEVIIDKWDLKPNTMFFYFMCISIAINMAER